MVPELVNLRLPQSKLDGVQSNLTFGPHVGSSKPTSHPTNASEQSESTRQAAATRIVHCTSIQSLKMYG